MELKSRFSIKREGHRKKKVEGKQSAHSMIEQLNGCKGRCT